MIETILEKAKKKVDSAEVFFSETLTNEISFDSGILKNAERKSIFGYALRVIHEGRVGFSSTTDPCRIGDMIDNARECSQFGKKTGFAFPAQSNVLPVHTFDPNIEKFTPDEAVEEGRCAVETLLDTCPKGLTDVSLFSSVTSIRIANTSGIDMSYRFTDFSHNVISTIIEGDSILWIGDGGHYGSLTLKTDKYVQKITDLAKKAEVKAPKISGSYPVIFTAEELPNLIQSIEMGIDGKRLVKGESPLIGREGERVLGAVTLVDDPFIGSAPGSRPFDDEGTPSQCNVLFEDGVFKNFLFDLDTAADANRRTTGSAARSMLSTPDIDTSNLVMTPGKSNLSEMISSLDKGIIVYGALGGGQSNLLAGDFALNIMLGFLVSEGEITGRVTDTMISGNVYNSFGNIAAMGSETSQVGSLFLPDVMFSELSISCR
ncbi:TldD/PmbA family protein [Candidatus Latescibacterota bacterium]